MAADNIKKNITMALAVCLVCSVLVSTSVVLLKPRQDSNKQLEKIRNILIAGNLADNHLSIKETYQQKIQTRLIELKSGSAVDWNTIHPIVNPDQFEIKTVLKEPSLREEIPAALDLARIKFKSKYMPVYLVKEKQPFSQIILPIYGKGLWSTMYGFIALADDLKTIRGFTFYDHGETPGLGGEIDNPQWKALWPGKKAFDDQGNLKLSVLKGQVDASKPQSIHQVDGLSGATLTSKGVDQLLKFWLGSEGYGPYLKRLQEQIENE
jgi:Na+-transporting NADH:ubiquinone oxidoreductase subunit C